MLCISRNIDLSPFTTIRIGGRAAGFCEPSNLEELQYALFFALDKSLPLYILGKGSNTIFGDFEGLVISMKRFREFKVKEQQDKVLIWAGAGVSLSKLVSFSLREGIEGFYRLVGFPATVGGAVAMNAGAFGYEVSQHLREVVLLDWEGRIKKVKREDLEFSYRSSPFPALGFLLTAIFEVPRAKGKIREEYKIIKEKRASKQPIDMLTCGSTFKNPKGYYAGRLLEEVGIKGYRVGDVAFSEKHANFLVNLNKGTYGQVIKILQEAKRRVFEEFGINLEEEVRIVESSSAYGWKVQ
ncbi:MAG: UDP-N-acetylmuramate dehydrogenase [Aquificaceae bacterium]